MQQMKVNISIEDTSWRKSDARRFKELAMKRAGRRNEEFIRLQHRRHLYEIRTPAGEVLSEWRRRRFVTELLNLLSCNVSFFRPKRIRRGSGPWLLREYNARAKAWAFLVKDFEGRCAYSMRHIRMAGGETHMEVDHFNPKLRGKQRNKYENLMLAELRHCNLKKRDYWPTPSERQNGYRILNIV